MTLRERRYTACEHPALREEMRVNPQPAVMSSLLGSVTRIFCRTCGAEKQGAKWRGGTLDFDEKAALEQYGCVQRWFDANG